MNNAIGINDKSNNLSAIHNAAVATRDHSSDISAKLSTIIKRLETLESQAQATAKSTQQAATILDDWDADGLPAGRA